jgi:hypothetical protein
MKPSIKTIYAVTCSIKSGDITACAILDKKNSSIHLHFYSEIFGSGRRPILVKHVNTKFPDGDDVSLIKEFIMGELPKEKVQINRVTMMKEKEVPANQTRHPHRVIIRFKK